MREVPCDRPNRLLDDDDDELIHDDKEVLFLHCFVFFYFFCLELCINF